ncbi:MAG: LemA family protein [Candidatus Gottesmanbacteria bacterium]|nr:LemA family protein [Candidatus Gottesmanbacteria bacterium]
MTPLWIVLGLVVLAGIYFWSLYNGLVSLKTNIEEGWSQIDVQLKRRADLIPNLVESVKGYAKHEKTVFSDVTKARSAMMGARSMESKAQASDMLTSALGKLIAIAEAYPQLKANENFLQLQKELSDTEDKVAYSRQYYNNLIRDYNEKIRTFPNTLFNESLGFHEKEYFEASQEERKAVKVKFE